MLAEDEVGFFDETLAGFADGSMVEHEWLVVENERGDVVAAACYAPEPFADRMWNLYFIAVSPTAHGRGLGTSLVRHIEHELRSRGEETARVLVIETSSTEQYERTRDFYRWLGYDEEARIRQFYGPDDDKVVFEVAHLLMRLPRTAAGRRGCPTALWCVPESRGVRCRCRCGGDMSTSGSSIHDRFATASGR